MRVTVYGPLRSATDAKTVDVAFDGGSVRDALDAVVDAYPRMERYLLDDDGELRASVRVVVNDARAAFDDDCPSDADVRLHPAVQGGRR